MMKLDWIKRRKRKKAWYRLNKLNFKKVPNGEGVYVIWHKGILGYKKCVYVGQGVIRDRLKDHRRNDSMKIYEICGALRVTWALVSADHQDGVEKYLADQLNPLEGERHPDVPPIAVNLPFQVQ